MKTHGILIDKSISDKELFNKLKILGKKYSLSNPWELYKIDFSNNLDYLAKRLQKSLLEKFYFHYYDNNRIVVVFPKKIFKITHNKEVWKDMLAYGLSLGIPEKQLSLFPSNFDDEPY
jgi:hypothetical protein